MAFTSAFFDAELVGGEYDRVYSAEKFAEYFASFIANGVFPSPSTNLQVVANTVNDMNVLVNPGMGWINGYYCKNDGFYPLAVQAASGTLNRIDAVVIGWSRTNREITTYIKTGTAASSPTAPSLTRNADLYELMLATITVNAGVTKVTQAMITDKRPDSSVCGWVKGVVDQIDTTDLFAQYDDAFQTWFEDIQKQLSGDVATSLQYQINQLKDYNSSFANTYEPLLSWGVTYKKVTFRMRVGESPVYGLIVKDGFTGRYFGSGDRDLTIYLNVNDLFFYGVDNLELIIPLDLSYTGENKVAIDVTDPTEVIVDLPVTPVSGDLTFDTSRDNISFSSRISHVVVWMCGGGGSGAAGRANNNSSYRVAGTGGSGAYTSQQSIENSPGQFLGSLEIGAGGEGVANTVSDTYISVHGGRDGSPSKLVSLSGDILMEAQGGKGGSYGTNKSDFGINGVSGGSGSGGVYAASSTSNSGIGVGGSDGSDGGSSGKVSGIGGIGQGTTTRPFGDSAFPLCCGAGGGAFWWNINSHIYGTAGSGGSDGTGSFGNTMGLVPTTPGSGSGACIGTYNGEGTTVNTSAPGANGVCYMRLVQAI